MSPLSLVPPPRPPLPLEGRRVLVVGLGRSGVSAARLCARRGAEVTATDRRPPAELPEQARALSRHGVRLEAGEHRTESFTGAGLIVLSPGVPEIPPLRAARAAGVPVIGEMELGFRLSEAPLWAITGTNGKSTTTALLGEMVRASGAPTFVGGNLGQPLCEAVDTPAAGPGGALVVEVSSFQLETVQAFRANIALLLNLSEDHLDRYPHYAAYLAAKARLFERQRAADVALLNGAPGQADCRRLAAGSPARRALFALACLEQSGPAAWLEDEQLVLRLDDGTERYPRQALRLAGRHNVENALAALLAARLGGVSREACARALASFGGLPHRMELCAERGGVRFYNDSKATNVGSVVGSLSGFERPVVLIAGGKDKGGDYAPLLPLLGPVVRQVVLIGAAAERIAAALGQTVPLHRAPDLPAAVARAAALARPGEAVVLSPACSSFDMFDNFEQRGEVFCRAARALAEPTGGQG